MPERPEINDLQSATLEWIDRFAPYGVVATDRDLRVRSWNSWMQRHSGMDCSAVIGRKITEVFPDLERRRLLAVFERGLQGEVGVISTALHGWLLPLKSVVREASYPFMKQTARIAPLITNQQISGVIIVIEDVTQREWQSQILARQHTRDEILAWALAHLMRASDPRRITREVFCKVAEHLDFDSYLLHLFDPQASIFKLQSSGGIDHEQEKLVQSFTFSAVPWITDVKEGQMIVRENVQSSTDPLLEITRKLGFRAYVALPLISGSTLLGLFCFATRTRDTVAAGEADLLNAIAQYLAVALNRERTDRELRDAQKQLNQHAHDLEQKVAERTASLKQIIAELQTFSYTIAHDLRAPIRALKGYCEVLMEDYTDKMPPEAVTVVGRLHNSSLQMDALTRDLLEFSKISRQDLTISPVNLSQVIADAVTLGGGRMAASVTVREPLLPVLANRTLVGQCVSNLLQNALKFGKPGASPAIKVWSEIAPPKTGDTQKTETSHFSRSRYAVDEAIAGAEHSSSPRVRVWFEDNGIGISQEAQQKIFGIFERGDRAGEFEGTGIGLAIVARAMERMGGESGVESKLGEGSRFWLEFRGVPETEAKGL